MEKLSKLPKAKQVVGGSVGFDPMRSDTSILALLPLKQCRPIKICQRICNLKFPSSYIKKVKN